MALFCPSHRHFGGHRLPDGGARSSKVEVSCKRGTKIAKSHFPRNLSLEWPDNPQSGAQARQRAPKWVPKRLQIAPKCPQMGFEAFILGSFSLIWPHFQGSRSRRVLKELAGHLRASTLHKNDPIMWHHLATMAEKASSDGSAISLNSKPLVDPHTPFRPIHFTI